MRKLGDLMQSGRVAVTLTQDAALYLAGAVANLELGRMDLALVDLSEGLRRLNGAQDIVDRIKRELAQPLASREAAHKCGVVSARLEQEVRGR